MKLFKRKITQSLITIPETMQQEQKEIPPSNGELNKIHCSPIKSLRGNKSESFMVPYRTTSLTDLGGRFEERNLIKLSETSFPVLCDNGNPLSVKILLGSLDGLNGQPRGYGIPSNAMLFDDDPGIMSEVETSSTGFRRGGKQRSSLPVVRTPSKTLERPLGLVFLQYRNETKRALLPNEITSIDTVKALFVRSFPKQLTMEYLDSPNVKIYIHDSSKDMFYELEDLRSHLREIRDRSVLRLFESADVSGGLPMAGIGIAGGVGHFEDPSYFSEPEFDSEYQHQHIHKSKNTLEDNHITLSFLKNDLVELLEGVLFQLLQQHRYLGYFIILTREHLRETYQNR
ncbi:hypothetical protein HHI36_006124 [Cryptolaemus montrouzieri]|uniref:Actin interacting protein 3-like C-terminal domain-containing protein n=1 Tax=Cryptolaemus montrouzieri TaxID=559131 RepID=A0ABD2NW43_9CUCU